MNKPTIYDHTPGPWEVVEDRVPSSIEIFAGKTSIAECWRRAEVKKEKADALLLAAAPDLLRERDELAAKLGRVKEIANESIDDSDLQVNDWVIITGKRLHKIIKECE